MTLLQMLTGKYRVEHGHREILYSVKRNSIIEKGKRFFTVTENPFAMDMQVIGKKGNPFAMGMQVTGKKGNPFTMGMQVTG